MTTNDDIDIDAILTQRNQIAIIWTIEDVQQVRPDLDEDQCWEVLKECKHNHDQNYGFNWQLIECVAEQLFGDAPEDDDRRPA